MLHRSHQEESRAACFPAVDLEQRPLYSPEGDRIAFVSDRTGGGDIYVLTLKTGALRQLTMDDGLERLDA